MRRDPGVDLLIGIGTEQEQHHRAGIYGSINRKPGPVIVRQRGVDNDKIIGFSKKLPSGCRNIMDNTYRVIVRAGKQSKQRVIKFLRL